MKAFLYSGLVFLTIISLIIPAGCSSKTPKALPQAPLSNDVMASMLQESKKSYTEIFHEAVDPRYPAAEIGKMKEYLDKSKDYCVASYESRSKQYDQELRQAAMELYRVGGGLEESERNERHCQIQNLRILKARAEILADQAIPVAYENRKAKLEVLEKWPGEYREIMRARDSGEYQERPYANVKDIGYRVIQEDQEDDVQKGLQAIQQLRRQGAIPPEIQNPEISEYVQRLAEKIATHSDLQVPVKMTVLNSKEINAFALPGGFLYVQRGLLEEADNESELVGVLSHEIAHVSARHGHRLQRKATIANILLQATRIAGAFVGGEALYYALRFGGMGLGLALNLDVLGKSRDFELEADQLGIQYAWNSGYDPNGFFQFFDKMATRKGYVIGASWFRTHPPFYERMVQTKREIAFLTPRAQPIIQTDEFQKMQAALKDIPVPVERMEQRRGAQMIPIRTEGCAPPQETRGDRVQYLEDVCQLGADADNRKLAATKP